MTFVLWLFQLFALKWARGPNPAVFLKKCSPYQKFCKCLFWDMMINVLVMTLLHERERRISYFAASASAAAANMWLCFCLAFDKTDFIHSPFSINIKIKAQGHFILSQRDSSVPQWTHLNGNWRAQNSLPLSRKAHLVVHIRILFYFKEQAVQLARPG